MRLIRTGALLCACALLMGQGASLAEEKRLGDYIYVPAMSQPGSLGTISLRVEALGISPEGETEAIDGLAGAEFGVYVYDSNGQLTPWANPLSPSEPMRIRTVEGETSFTLPQGTEFYLRQESAPEGYVYDADALIPVTGEPIVVKNEMEAQLAIAVVDRLGSPVPGVTLTVAQENGETVQLVTDASGQALYASAQDARVSVAESALPQGVSEALSVTVDGAAMEGPVQMKMATRTSVVFEHAASGTVQVEAVLSQIDAHAQRVNVPLAGVNVQILCDSPVQLVTDGDGRASVTLEEGTYDIALTYEGEEDAVLPAAQGQVIVVGGETTTVELTATRRRGRVAVQADAQGEKFSGGSVTLVSEETGETFGPYAMDAEGLAVSDLLEAGVYRVRVEAPQNMEVMAISGGDGAEADAAEGLTLEVLPGELSQASVQMLRRQTQTFELIVRGVGESGQVEESGIDRPLALELLNAQGEVVAQFDAQEGRVRVEAVAGTYTLRMAQADADALGVVSESEPFALPGQEETLAFDVALTRLVLSSVDDLGRPVSGAVYEVTDAAGNLYTVTTGEDGRAVTPLLQPGNVHIVTKTAPQDHDVGLPADAVAQRAEAVCVEVVHERYGTARLDVRMRSLNQSGEVVLSPVAGVGIRLLRIEDDGQRMTDTDIELTTQADGSATVQLAPGEYVAQVREEQLEAGCRSGQALRFTVYNTQQSEGELICLDALGGVRAELIGGELSEEELAQVRFELLSPDGQSVSLTMQDGVFYAGGLESGTYVLRQTQIPQGYTLAAERTVSVSGGEVTHIDVPLEEYALLSVSKTGLTFDDQLRTYVVPLTGEYGIYTKEEGEFKPYPSADEQMTVWANVAQNDAQRASRVKLPAAIEGTTYYLMEIGGDEGFTHDTEAHEITLYAGETRVMECGVSSARGFFRLEVTDVTTGAPVSGGEFELVDAAGSTVLSFTMGNEAYQNDMAVPVGTYTLRQTAAAQGYALCAQPELTLEVQPYLTQGGAVTSVSMQCLSLPETEQMEGMIGEMYSASEQGLTFVTVNGGTVRKGETLLVPQMTVSVSAKDGRRVNVASLVLASATDGEGGSYTARVEYCLTGGGWQMSDARMTGVLDAPTALSLADVEDEICAVRVTYLNAETGEEIAGDAFTPGQLTLNVQVSAEDAVELEAEAVFSGTLEYQTEPGTKVQRMERTAERKLAFSAQGMGVFETVSAGRDGKISGVAFFDEDADGELDSEETGRYAGLSVSLLAQSGEVIATTRTGTDGSYAFDAISGGVYTVQFDAGETVVFSASERYSAHKTSGVVDTHYGMSALMTIDGDHTDYVVNAGCIYAASLTGAVHELYAGDQVGGVGGLTVEMRAVDCAVGEEPSVVMTNDLGEFGFTGVLPGEYEIRFALEEGYLCDQAEDGVVSQVIRLEQGDSVSLGEVIISKAASVSGAVRVDDDGDGIIDDAAQALDGVRVVLLNAADGHTDPVAETVTDASGAYCFDHLSSGSYSVLFELEGEWTFTRYGEDSDVYGAVSQSGSTRTFDLAVGEQLGGIDAGVTIPAQMSVTVFQDAYADGQMGPTEEGLAGVDISLIRLENGEDAEAVMYSTDESGNVLFAGVSPGEYVIAYRMPGQWRATAWKGEGEPAYPESCVPQSTLATGRSEPFVLSMGQSGVRLYIGAAMSGSLSGVVYYDDNADALLGDQESLCPGVSVALLDESGAVLAQTVSGEDGRYAFDGLASGRYRVRFEAPDGCGFSATEQTAALGSAQQTTDSVSQSRLISVSGGESITTADASLVRLCGISGRLFEDQNASGTMDDGELGLAGVNVQLLNSTGRTILATATTDADGAYAFDRLMPDSYMLRVDAPEQYVFSDVQSDSPIPLESERDGRGYSTVFALRSGARVENVRFGLYTQGSVSGRIWNDADYDGLIGEQESGLRGAQLVLLDAAGNSVASMQTPSSGEFVFDSLAPGSYALQVTLETGYVYTTEGADSLAARSDEVSTVLSLGNVAMGQALEGVNIGALKPASVGGTVWYDADGNGRRVSGDAGVPSKVSLRMCSGPDAGKVYEATTDADGVYRFDGVMPGSAQLTFEVAQGLAFTRQVSGVNRVSTVPQTDALTAQSAEFTVESGKNLLDMDAGVVGVGVVSGVVWEDSAYDGQRGADERGVPGVTVTLTDAEGAQRTSVTDETGAYAFDFVRAGEYTVTMALPGGMMFTRDGTAIAMTDASEAGTEAFTLAMGESRMDLNAGTIVPASVTGRIGVDADESGTLEDQEEGLGGAVITLVQGGTVVATTDTRPDGTYVLSGLRPGNYRVRIALPQNVLFARGVALELAGEDAQEGQTAEWTLTMGEQATLAPVPAVRTGTVAGRAWSDTNADGRMDADEPALPGTRVVLLDMQKGGEAVSAVEVGEDGLYTFDLLRTGAYALRFILPEGELFADRLAEEGASCVEPVEGNDATTATFNLAMGEERRSMNVGAIRAGEIGDTVWLDQNGNGLQDYREPLLSGVKLTLLHLDDDGQTQEVAQTVSDAYGYYHFSDLRPGVYVIRLDKESGDTLTYSIGEPLGEIDSDLDPETGMSEAIRVTSGQVIRNIDVGLTEHGAE